MMSAIWHTGHEKAASISNRHFTQALAERHLMMSSPSDTTVDAPSTPSRNSPVWLTPSLLVLGLVAGLVAEPVFQANKERFFTATGLPPIPPALMWKVFWDNVYNHSICFGFLGMVVCGFMSMAVGLAIHSNRAVYGMIVGSLVGLLAGPALGMFGWYISERLLANNFEIDSVIKVLLIFFPFWFGLSLAACFAALLVRRKLSHFLRAVLPSMIFTIISVFLYVSIITIVFPSDWPGRIIPEHAHTRIVLNITGCLGVAAAVLATIRACGDHRLV